jgi:hypothetical protein
VILNGIPDWLYEEEILSKNNAIWFSPNGSRLCFASFDDSLVDVVSFPFYGSTEEVVKGGLYRIRYPKVLFVVNIDTTTLPLVSDVLTKTLSSICMTDEHHTTYSLEE